MKTPHDFFMDDVQTIALEATELIQKRLKEFGITLEPKDEDKFYVPLVDSIEEFSNGNYRKEM